MLYTAQCKRYHMEKSQVMGILLAFWVDVSEYD